MQLHKFGLGFIFTTALPQHVLTLSMTISIRQSVQLELTCQTELKCRGISAGAFESYDKGRVPYQALPGSTLNPSFRDQTARTRRRSSNVPIFLECMPSQSKTTIEDCNIPRAVA